MIYKLLAESYGYTPSQIADMTPEQQLLILHKDESGPQITTCSNLQEARQLSMMIKGQNNAKS